MQQRDSGLEKRNDCPTVNVAVLGATGSIGTATIDVLHHLDRIDPTTTWNLWAASGHRNVALLSELAGQFTRPPTQIAVSDPASAATFAAGKSLAKTQLVTGPEALVEIASAPEVDVVVAAIVGRAGLESTLAAVESGKRVALANKETLVVAGSLVQSTLKKAESVAARSGPAPSTPTPSGPARSSPARSSPARSSPSDAPRSGAELLPVDSEHSAIFQCLGEQQAAVSGVPACKPRKLILTASGGPFRNASMQEMHDATPQRALQHPTWEMGKKISIDSATMMNKALEVIEARWLFDIPAESIEVVVHPQSIIHSMVEFEDGSVIAQLSPPDMRLPIQYALTYPRRLACETPTLDRSRPWDLTLQPVDRERFPALELGFEVARVGGTAGSVVNAANEEAVGLFLDGKIRFTDIVPACRRALENHHHETQPTLTRLLELDRWARAEVRKHYA
ncbi:1-deoxy-D-xylulose 5-phosphate reductoisomerase [Novipirellula galeiformis]|uniref:1-deoxy-D-xylulose 5-phosphate reductoisomerase n=1 Tax=Novipirellula galeiformis TaxID=2528004 RepID=A0A5C6CL98_9BACT|nr:1-deoxy-D-xylulose-5-phosphate reductoisomerase [Novipirellula galeiformis]TWU24091.1 1-deoxy-D-xylulose 5-phosphate reductoisomerase [Novipirellula galeiformis]